MDLRQLLEKLDPALYIRLKSAVELGRWPNGRVLTEEQKVAALQAIIAYEIQHNFPEQERTGYLPPKEKKNNSSLHAETPLRWEP